MDSVNGKTHQTIFRFSLKMENDETELKITIAEIKFLNEIENHIVRN